MRRALAVVLVVLLIGCSGGNRGPSGLDDSIRPRVRQSYEMIGSVSDSTGRYYEAIRAKQLSTGPYPGPVSLMEDSTGGFVLLHRLKVQKDGTSVTWRATKDTLLAWVQHLGRDRPWERQVPPHAEQADLIITCYPSKLPWRLQKRHALPEGEGLIMGWNLGSGIFLVFSQSAVENFSHNAHP